MDVSARALGGTNTVSEVDHLWLEACKEAGVRRGVACSLGRPEGHQMRTFASDIVALADVFPRAAELEEVQSACDEAPRATLICQAQPASLSRILVVHEARRTSEEFLEAAADLV